ncbi:hypothetical protein HYDPIDRAFT_33435 [Hydnomerulius pinastri MD-312]|uniref:Unplaced genomic scaffold scaffold_60, whole genome shotgun sequence n=1 Tax=Hydnomerulius pinastri MD-312 TaxID=994086 RepID=A0A0C9V1W7_9AGAM|nr:hypothetical protein HYDPIDRAFT_33435 [Hydnomerulius pinastri MD-312]
MESFPIFFKVRAVTFTCIIILSFLWLVLLSVEIFTRWDISDRTSRSLMTVFMLTNTTTIIMLPILLLVEFRVWLDAARILLLLVAQIGSAAAFTYWNPQIQCPDQTADDVGVCKLIDVYTMMGCWIIPAFREYIIPNTHSVPDYTLLFIADPWPTVVLYSTYFAIMVYRQSRIPVVADPEPPKGRPSMLPVMTDPEMAEKRRPSTGSFSSEIDGESKGNVKAHVFELPPEVVQMPALPLSAPVAIPQRQSTLPPPPRRQSTLPSPPRRQSTLPPPPKRQSTFPPPLPSTHAPPVPALPPTAQRHMSLPHLKHSQGSGSRHAITVTIPAPLAPQSQSQSPSHSRSQSSLSPSSSHPVNLQPGAVDPRALRQGARHLSMMPPSSSLGRGKR